MVGAALVRLRAREDETAQVDADAPVRSAAAGHGEVEQLVGPGRRRRYGFLAGATVTCCGSLSYSVTAPLMTIFVPGATWKFFAFGFAE